MKMSWDDLTKRAQEVYLEYYAAKHAEWNGISIKAARNQLLEILENADHLFEVPNVAYEDTR